MAVYTKLSENKLKEFFSKYNLGDLLSYKGIAEGIIFLLSDQSEYITGTELIIDGGVTARP